MSAILNSKMADRIKLNFFLNFFYLILAKHDFISLFILRNAIFISTFIIWEISVF